MGKGFSDYYTNREKALDLKKSAVLIVDMMNDFCKPGGRMVLEDGYLIVEPIQRLVAAARAHKIPIVWICQKYRMDKYDKVTEKRVGTCYEGTWGAEQIDELPILPEDYVVNKRRYSGFFQTDLDLTLRELGVDTLIAFGCDTNICVLQTLAGAYFRGYKTVVPADACGTFLVGTQEQGLEYFARCYDSRVVDTETALGYLGADA